MTKEKFYTIFDRLTEYSFYGLIFFLAISKARIEVFTVLALIGFIGKKILRPDFKFLKFQPNFFLLLFIIFCVFSLVNSWPYLSKSIHALFLKWLKRIMLFVIAGDIFIDRKRFKTAIIVFLTASFIVGIDGLTQKFFGWELFNHALLIVKDIGLSAITATFSHYNGLGSYLIVVLSLILSLVISNRLNKAHRIVLFALMVLLMFCLFFTFSRGSWIGLFSAVIFMLILSGNIKELAVFLVIFIFGGVCVPGLKERLFYVFQTGGDSQRFEVWRSAWVMIKERIFIGHGIGTFMDIFPKYGSQLEARYAHNCFLQIWAETGLFSLICFLLFISFIFYHSIKVFYKNQDYLLLGLICAMFGFLVASSFDTQLYSLNLAALFWVFMGMISARINDFKRLEH